MDGHQAFVATWMNTQSWFGGPVEPSGHWNTFQIVLVDVDDDAGADVDVVVNDGSATADSEGSDCPDRDFEYCMGLGLGDVPTRVADTREGGAGPRLGDAEDRTVALDGSVPVDANGAVVNLTAVNPGQAGFLTQHPCGSPLAATSTVNDQPGEIVPAPALVVVPPAANTTCVYTHKATDVVADVDAITYDLGPPIDLD